MITKLIQRIFRRSPRSKVTQSPAAGAPMRNVTQAFDFGSPEMTSVAAAAAGAATPGPASGGSTEESDAACVELLPGDEVLVVPPTDKKRKTPFLVSINNPGKIVIIIETRECAAVR